MIEFDYEWLDPEAAVGVELRATWARISIRINGQAVTRVLGNASKTVRDSIYLPIYPLAEWLAGNWWAIQHEVDSPSRRTSFSSRHNIKFAQEGFALPHLTLTAIGQRLACTWARPEKSGLFRSVEFLGHGMETVEKSEAIASLSTLLDQVNQRLLEFDVADTRFQQDWMAINSADADERQFCEYAGMLGVDPYAADENLVELLTRARGQVPTRVFTEFLLSVSPSEVPTTAERLATSLSDQSTTDAIELLDLVFQDQCGVQVSDQLTPWDLGYATAHNVHRRVSREAISEMLAAVPSDDGLATTPVAGVSRRGDSPLIKIRPAVAETSKIFSAARALGCWAMQAGNSASISTDSSSYLQQANRAFAAELLVPAADLQKRVGEWVATAEVEDLAQHYNVSPWVVQRQLQNHDIAEVEAGWAC